MIQTDTENDPSATKISENKDELVPYFAPIIRKQSILHKYIF